MSSMTFAARAIHPTETPRRWVLPSRKPPVAASCSAPALAGPAPASSQTIAAVTGRIERIETSNPVRPQHANTLRLSEVPSDRLLKIQLCCVFFGTLARVASGDCFKRQRIWLHLLQRQAETA